MMRVFLVEDEPPAMRKLQRMVATQADMAVCGMASTYREAVSGIMESKPDLLVLDIHLPDGTGFEVLQSISDPESCQVIFLTAYDEYALEAFDAAALDYLVKPVTYERFQQSMQRARGRVSGTAGRQAERYTKRFLVERLKTVYVLPVESVDWIAADRNYALLYGPKGEFVLRATMDSLEQRLDPEQFVRVSRSAIVRAGAVREVSEQMIVLHSGAQVPCSRKCRQSILARL